MKTIISGDIRVHHNTDWSGKVVISDSIAELVLDAGDFIALCRRVVARYDEFVGKDEMDRMVRESLARKGDGT